MYVTSGAVINLQTHIVSYSMNMRLWGPELEPNLIYLHDSRSGAGNSVVWVKSGEFITVPLVLVLLDAVHGLSECSRFKGCRLTVLYNKITSDFFNIERE